MTNSDWPKHPYYSRDPLLLIEPALLNSVDIKRYVDKGCLIEKDSFDSKRMKPASYEMRFLGELYDWHQVDGILKPRHRSICENECATLYKNSISYLWTKERLLLPEYIAARFNLRIRDVHKGLLLGTGPLIDPGFGGRILIPLHNLTDNDYKLKGGDGIIWVEFTKVSKHDYWQSNDNNTKRPSDLIAFPPEKIIDDPHNYLSKAGVMSAGGVQSAFRGALERAQSAATNAQKYLELIESRIMTLGILGLIAAFVGVGSLIFSAYQIYFPVMEKVHSQRERIGKLEDILKDIERAQSAGPGVSMDEPLMGTEETTSVEAQPVDTADNPLEPEIPTPLTR